jgi:hypothetical protein
MRNLGLALAAALIAAACANPNSAAATGELTIQRLSAGGGSFDDNSGFDKAEGWIIRNPFEWSDVWTQIHRNRSPKPALPEIDFAKEQVVVVAMGAQSSSGYSIRITGASRQGDGVVIRTETQMPGSGCFVLTVLTQPIDLARMPRTSGSATFEEHKTVRNCG